MFEHLPKVGALSISSTASHIAAASSSMSAVPVILMAGCNFLLANVSLR